MRPRTRLSKFLAKIAGQYDGELEPKTEVEQYLNQIAESGGGSSGGGTFVVTASGWEPGATLDKTYAEIMEAIGNGQSIFVVTPLTFDEELTGYTHLIFLGVQPIKNGYTVYLAKFDDGGWAGTYDYASDSETGVLRRPMNLDPGLFEPV